MKDLDGLKVINSTDLDGIIAVGPNVVDPLFSIDDILPQKEPQEEAKHSKGILLNFSSSKTTVYREY